MNEIDPNEIDSKQPRRGRRSGLIAWVLACLAVIGIAIARMTAPDADHALANILTVGLGILAWAFAVFALISSGTLRRAGLALFVAPAVALAAFFSCFRFERLDAELVPQFSWRWSPEADLQEVAATTDGSESLFAARETDFPQFLGSSRDGIVDASVSADWTATPPEIIWKKPIGEGWSGFAVQGDVAITMEQRDQSEWVSAYSIADGSILWKYENPALHTTVPGGLGPRSTPTIAGGRVYACSAVDNLMCLDLISGEKIWSQDLLALANTTQADFESGIAWGRSASPLVVDSMVVIPLGGKGDQANTLIAFDTESGEVQWRSGQGQAGYSSPVAITLDGVQQIVLVSEARVAGYEIETGKQLWESDWPGKSSADPAVAHPIQVSDTQLLLAKGYSEGSQLLEVTQAADGSGTWQTNELWRSKRVMKTKFTTAVIHGDYAYGLSDGILECIEVATGDRQWKRGRYRHGQLLLLGDKLLILAESGDLVLVDASPDSFQELASLPVITNVSWNTLAISGDRLLVRNSDEAALIKLPMLEQETEPTPENEDAS
ncbi:MAG: PQQ-binding-like beta-propeller repeat protein [Planctomycetota bacterium]